MTERFGVENSIMESCKKFQAHILECYFSDSSSCDRSFTQSQATEKLTHHIAQQQYIIIMKSIFLSALLLLASHSAVVDAATIRELIETTESGADISADGTVSIIQDRELGSYADDYYYDDDDDNGYYDDDINNEESYNVNIRGTMEIGFMPDAVVQEPTQADINQFFDVTENFFLDNFEQFRLTRGKVDGFRMGYLLSQYFPAAGETDGKAKFLISFRAQASVYGQYNLNAVQVNKIMKMGTFVDYILEYLYLDVNSIWYKTMSVKYAGIPLNP